LGTAGKTSRGNNPSAKKTPLMSHVWLRKNGNGVRVRKSISNKEVTSTKAQRKKESLRKIERSLMRMDRGEQGRGRHEMRNRR